MTTIPIAVKHQPTRIGWCVKSGDFEALRKAVRLTYCLWGGRFNPIIPIDAPDLADQLIREFQVDILRAVTPDEDTKSFIAKYSHLPDPFSFEPVFRPTNSGGICSFLDISQMIRRLTRKSDVVTMGRDTKVRVLSWENNDPLRDVCLMTYGALPTASLEIPDYLGILKQAGAAIELEIESASPLPFIGDTRVIADLSRAECVARVMPSHWNLPGIFEGKAGDFNDLVSFWNLRASGVKLIFFDAAYTERMNPYCEDYIAQLRKDFRPSEFNREPYVIWRDRDDQASPLSADFIHSKLGLRHLWNGRNLHVAAPYISITSVLAPIHTHEQGAPSVTFQVPQLQLDDEREAHFQHCSVSLDFGLGLFGNEQWTYSILPIDDMNKFYGFKAHYAGPAVRVGPGGLRIIERANLNKSTVNAVNVRESISALFETRGVSAEISQPGRIAEQLIKYVGGLQGGRLFKVEGLRDLINKFDPHESFTRSSAILTINSRRDGNPTFGMAKHQNIFLSRKQKSGALTADIVFEVLLSKKLVRAGLEFKCPRCELNFWRSIDDLGSNCTCEYCEFSFNSLPQLKDRDWKYRRTGLLGDYNHQEGAIPVILTLQQFSGIVSRSWSPMFTVAHTFRIASDPSFRCETDFVFVCKGNERDPISVVLGECKTKHTIDSKDVENLIKIAQALASDRITVYLSFSKTSEFTQDELTMFKKYLASHKVPFILLGKNELEPYRPYERVETNSKVNKYPVCLRDMVDNTNVIYFTP